jgi:hypothetical protein
MIRSQTGASMANGRGERRDKRDKGRDPGGFVALPWAVLDCPAYAQLGHPARCLLFELARQFVRNNNGRLLASAAHLKARGWTSSDVIGRAKRELLEAGFIFETVKGHRPNRASWYAVTWRELNCLEGFDPGAAAGFERGAYLKARPKNAGLSPSGGVERHPIAPSGGVGAPPPTPSGGAMRATFGTAPTPSDGHHLEKPSVVPG